MRITLAVAALIATIGFTGTAQAQVAPGQSALEARIDRLEREMRAVQRKVFPGGAGATVEPEITPATVDDAAGGSSSPVADLTQRVASLEAQVATLTGQVEQLQYRQRQLEDAFAAYKRTTDARLKALEDAATAVTPAPGSTAATETDTVVTPTPRPTTRPATPPATATTTPAATTPAATTPPAATGTRAARLAAIQRPSTSDPAEDGYVYGYRLWQAQLYPEARKALEEVVAKYPKHRRASFAQNLLGRAYLDAGAPSLAAVAFYQNYKTNPSGERAPDSLYYLAQALTQLKKPPAEICKVYAELTQLYGDRISEEMKAGVAEGRMRNKCK
ncbi:tetratricopeptide repeat protein [Sphingomonas sp. LB-2]|nr:tetratricopeptide repeat protein [Sphingomonas caeni]